MFRFSFLALVITKQNFSGARLRLWLHHAPCEKYECDVCNPVIGSISAL